MVCTSGLVHTIPGTHDHTIVVIWLAGRQRALRSRLPSYQAPPTASVERCEAASRPSPSGGLAASLDPAARLELSGASVAARRTAPGGQVAELGFGEVAGLRVDGLGQLGEQASTPCGVPLSKGSARPVSSSRRSGVTPSAL